MALVNTQLGVSVAGTLTNPKALTTGQAPLSYVQSLILGTGTGANQADKLWSDTRTLAASAVEDLDLAGVLVDALGVTATFARVKGLIIAASRHEHEQRDRGRRGRERLRNLGRRRDAHRHRAPRWRPRALRAGRDRVRGDRGHRRPAARGQLRRGHVSVTYDVVIVGASA
jgi:hypothetical protein